MNYFIKVVMPNFPESFLALSQNGCITNSYNEFCYFQTAEEAEEQARVLRRLWRSWELTVEEYKEEEQ